MKIEKNQSYLVDPSTFKHEKLSKGGDHNMYTAGWLVDNAESGIEYTTSTFVEHFDKVQGTFSNGNKKKKKTTKLKKDTQENVIVQPVAMPELALEVGLTPSFAIVVDPASQAVLDSLVQPKDKELDRQIAKTSKSGLDGYMGIEEYFIFGVQFTALIPVEQCNLAPLSYKCRPLSDDYVKYLVKQFAGHSRPNSNAADLMPYDPVTNLPLRSEEIDKDKIEHYHYWILSGQHSVMAARGFLRVQNEKYAKRKVFYEKRIARIVVNAPKEIAVRISKMENIETQTIMKTQPYVEILKHARGQWLAYSMPKKPKPGVPVGHNSRKLWDVSLCANFFLSLTC